VADPGGPGRRRVSQADRRARSRQALLESAARELSRHGYGNLVLERVASEAGYTRGALYHQFKDKQALALAVIEWSLEAWRQEVLPAVLRESEPVAALLAMARGHAVFCRRDVARMPIALRLEFSGQDHPVAHAVEASYGLMVDRIADRVEAAYQAGALPPGPPSPVIAAAITGALEGVVIGLSGQEPHDELLAARAVAGVLGLDAGRLVPQ
jgi:AcrR family transcriptional regulator